MACSSAVLVADAAHSLSDTVSDVLSLWIVRFSRLEADENHPYGHGKVRSAGACAARRLRR